MRPNFDAYLINAHVVISAQESPQATRELAFNRWVQMFGWLRWLSPMFEQSDRIQMFVGFKKPPTPLLKGWVPVDRIREADPLNLGAVGGNLVEMTDWGLLNRRQAE